MCKAEGTLEVRHASTVDVSGWDFGWLDGRATEERPLWGFAGIWDAELTGPSHDFIPLLGERAGHNRLAYALPAQPRSPR